MVQQELIGQIQDSVNEEKLRDDKLRQVVRNGVVRNGVVRNGVVRNGVVRNGVVRNGVVRNGVVRNGVVRNGVVRDSAVRDGNQENSRGESIVMSELEKPDSNNLTIKEYLAYQTKVGVHLGYLFGSFFAVGGATGVMVSLSKASDALGASPSFGAWFPAVACVMGVATIISANKLRRTIS